MRICLLTRSLFPVIGGSETYVYSLGKALGELGHDVTVVTSTLPDECGRAYPYPFRVLRVPKLSEFNAAQAGLRTLVMGVVPASALRRRCRCVVVCDSIERCPDLRSASTTVPLTSA